MINPTSDDRGIQFSYIAMLFTMCILLGYQTDTRSMYFLLTPSPNIGYAVVDCKDSRSLNEASYILTLI